MNERGQSTYIRIHIFICTHTNTGLVNAANNSKRKQKHGLKISIYELRDVLLSIEPNKRMQDIGECVYRGFAMLTVEDAMSILGMVSLYVWCLCMYVCLQGFCYGML